MYKNLYIFPAIIIKLDDNDYNVKFPNFHEITTYGESLEEAYIMAEDALKLCLFDMFIDNKEIQEPTKLEDIKLESNQTIILVKVNLKETIRSYDNKAIKKTLTIPSWLNKEAENAHLNFSKILQIALKEHLDMSDKNL
jgi:predicted RNase H-like HicB family nuclease